MLTCTCGSILISDGEYWYCPYRNDRNYHDRGWAIETPDLRFNSIREREGR